MNAEGTKKTSFTYELTNDQQELLLGVMLNGNYRKREVPYSLWSIEGDHFNATLYEKEKHGRRKLCVQGSKAEEFVLFQLEPLVLGGASLGYEADPSSEEVKEIVFPKEFDAVLEAYNALQLSRGFDLRRAAGKPCLCCSYDLVGYPGWEGRVVATLYIRHGRLIGGDVHTASAEGFMAPL